MRHSVRTAIFAVLLLAIPAAAQTPQTDPALTDPSNDDIIREQSRKPADIPPVEPTPSRPPQRAIPSFVAPGATEAGLDPASVPAGRFFAEGTLVRDRRGTLAVSDQGDVILVPLPGDRAPLFVMLPSQRLSQMMGARAAGGEETRFLISGQVFVYRDREFLMPTVFAVEHQTQVVAPSTEPQPTTQAETTVPAAAQGDPRIADLMRDLESQRLGPRRITAPSTVAPPAARPTPDGASVALDQTLRPEGTLLVARRGRLIRLAEAHGRLALSLDNDPDSPAAKPFILQPCRLLERMEALAATRGDDLVFRVSGRVTVYDGRNYLLPTFEQVTPPGDVIPMQ